MLGKCSLYTGGAPQALRFTRADDDILTAAFSFLLIVLVHADHSAHALPS